MRKLFASCTTVLLLHVMGFTQTNPLLRYLPENVNSVIHIDVKSLGSKIPGETFRQSIIYQQLMKNPEMPLNALFSEPEKLGIDLSAGIIVAMHDGGYTRFRKSQPEVYVLIKLKNGETFTSSLNKMLPPGEDGEKKEIYQTYGTDRIIANGTGPVAGWNNDVFILTTSQSEEMKAEIEKYMVSFSPDTVEAVDTMPVTDTAIVPPTDYTEMTEKLKKLQRNYCFELLTPKNSGKWFSNKLFLEMLLAKGDIRVWNGKMANPATGNMLPFADLFKKLQSFSGEHTVSLINFENGKIVMQSRAYLNEELSAIYQKYPIPGQNMELIKRLPAGNLVGLANFSFSQQMAREFFEKSGLPNLIDSFKNQIPFDVNLLQGAFKSEFTAAVIQSEVNDNMDEWTKKSLGFQLILALPILDKSKFDQIRAKIPALIDSMKKEKETFMKDPPLVAKHTDDLLLVSFSQQTIDAFLKGTPGQTHSWMTAYSQYPMLMSLNLGELVAMLPSGESRKSRQLDFVKSMFGNFDKILAYGGQYEKGSVNSTAEVTFRNTRENALKQLFEMINTLAENKELMDEEEDSYYMDSVMVAPLDSAMRFPADIPIPDFEKSETAAFAKEYANIATAYLEVYGSGNTDAAITKALEIKVQKLDARMEKLEDRLRKQPAELDKWKAFKKEIDDLMKKRVDVELIDVKEEKKEVPPPPPPPPPKTEMKKKNN